MQIMSWWEEAVTVVPLTERRRFNGMVIYNFWNLWKERNMRIFNNFESVMQVAARIKDDIKQRRRAFGWRVFSVWREPILFLLPRAS
jgi:hypothetical protein